MEIRCCFFCPESKQLSAPSNVCFSFSFKFFGTKRPAGIPSISIIFSRFRGSQTHNYHKSRGQCVTDKSTRAADQHLAFEQKPCSHCTHYSVLNASYENGCTSPPCCNSPFPLLSLGLISLIFITVGCPVQLLCAVKQEELSPVHLSHWTVPLL